MHRPRLPVVLDEIAEKLLQDNWCRVSTQGQDQFYYIVGFNEQTAELNGEADFSAWEFPLPTSPGPLAESVSRSQVAEQNDYLKNARKDLERAGVPHDAISHFEHGLLIGQFDMKGWTFDETVPPIERAKLFSNFVQTLRLTHTNAHPLELGPDEVAEADTAREKRCLREITSKYQKIVHKWEQLEQLSFDDPQIKEASMTFLYGFYRASIVLCASAVETQLRRLCQSEDIKTKYLIDTARKSGCLQRDLADGARDLFNLRNRVAHEGVDPKPDKVKEMLGIARKLVAELRECARTHIDLR